MPKRSGTPSTRSVPLACCSKMASQPASRQQAHAVDLAAARQHRLHRGHRSGVAVAVGGGDLGPPPRLRPRLRRVERRVGRACVIEDAVGSSPSRLGERRRRDHVRDAVVVLGAECRCGSRHRAGPATSLAKNVPSDCAGDAADDLADEVALRDRRGSPTPCPAPTTAPARRAATVRLLPVVEVLGVIGSAPARQPGGVADEVADLDALLAVGGELGPVRGDRRVRGRARRGRRGSARDSAVIVFVVDQTLMIVSRSHGVVLRASSAWPPQMSTTTRRRARRRPRRRHRAPWSKLAANAAARLEARVARALDVGHVGPLFESCRPYFGGQRWLFRKGRRREAGLRGEAHLALGRREALTGHLGPVRSCVRPGDRASPRGVALASAAEVDAAVQRRRSPRSPSGARRRSGRASRSCSRFRELLDARNATSSRAIITAEHGKVLVRRAGEVARGLEVVEFACGIPHLLKGGLLRAGVDRHRRATRSASRSASSPASRRSTSRRWSRCGCSRSRSRAATRSSSSRARTTRPRRCCIAELLAEAGLPDGVFTVVHGDKEAVDALLDPSRRRGGELRRLDADREARLRDGHARTASACRRSAARRTTWSCCRTPTSTRRPTRRSSRGVRLGGRAVHGDLGRRRRRRRRRRRWSTRSRRACRAARSVPATSPAARWARWSPASTATGSRGYIDAGVDEGATLVVDGRGADVADGDGFFLGPCCSTT